MTDLPAKGLQLPLELPVEASSDRDDLIVGPSNRLAASLIDTWPDWPSNTVVLAGPVGSGKTHLARIWAARSGAGMLNAADLAQVPDQHFLSSGLVVEDFSEGRFDQEALFHLFNAVKASGGYLLMTSRAFPGAWGITIPKA